MTTGLGPTDGVAITPRPFIDALTGLRFVAAAAVLLEHFPQVIPGVAPARLAQGGAGVSLFFVLSGFVLTLNYGDRFAAGTFDRRDFLVKRAARLVPLHLAVLGVQAVVVFIRDNPIERVGPVQAVGSLAANTVLVNAWVPAKVLDLWNPPSWSISAELFFYLLFPLLIPVVVAPIVRRRRIGAAIVGVIIVELIAFVALALVLGSILLDRGSDPESARLILLRFARFPAIRVGEFLAGCLVAALYRHHVTSGDSGQAAGSDRAGGTGLLRFLATPLGRQRILIGAAVAYLAIQWSPQYLDGSIGAEASSVWSLIDLRLFASYVPISVIVVAAVAWGDSPIARFLSTPTMIRLGQASYALYIIQWLGWRAINDPAIGPPGPWLAGAAIATCIVASLVVHDLVEQPARRWVLARSARSTRSTGSR